METIGGIGVKGGDFGVKSGGFKLQNGDFNASKNYISIFSDDTAITTDNFKTIMEMVLASLKFRQRQRTPRLDSEAFSLLTTPGTTAYVIFQILASVSW